MLRTCVVRLFAIPFTLSVRSFQVPDTPLTFACPPSFPSVPTSRATRVTSSANDESWSTIALTVVPMRRNSPLTGRPSIFSCIFWFRSPSATASMTRATSSVGRDRSSIIELTASRLARHEPSAPLIAARSVSFPSRPIVLARRTISSVVFSRVWVSSLNALCRSPTIPFLRVSSRSPRSPRTPPRSASSSAWRSAAATTAPSPPPPDCRRREPAVEARVLVCGATDPFLSRMGRGAPGIARLRSGYGGSHKRALVRNVVPRPLGVETAQSYFETWDFAVNSLGPPGQSLIEVGPDLLDVLEPDAQPEEPARDPVALPAVPALHRRCDAAEARRVRDEARCGLHRPRVAGNVERDHAAEAGIAHELDRRLRLEAAGDLGCALGVAVHSRLERGEP